MSFSSGAILKAGTIQGWGSSTSPDGWLICDGSTISRTLYVDLFNAIGTTYGAGDGITTFNLPNGKIPVAVDLPVRGNGTTIGFNDGINNFGMAFNGTSGHPNATKKLYGQPVGTAFSGSYINGQKSFGITTDPTKSGIIADLTAATDATYAIIKY